MSAATEIEWADATFNGWRGCTKISAGCDNCYAETASRISPRVLGEWGPRGKRVVGSEAYWREPLKWNRHTHEDAWPLVFCASMGDVFEDHPVAEANRPRLWELVRKTPRLWWAILTKRPERIGACLPADWGDGYSNVLLGVTVENRAALSRLTWLQAVPAAMRFISAEPLLEDLGRVDLHGIDWLIVGGETGTSAREMDPEWARSLRDQCPRAGVRFFMKQMTGKAPIPADLLVREWPCPTLKGKA